MIEESIGRLWIVAAPSGGGKTSLVEAAIAKVDNLVRSISFTTREQRVGEINGRDYNFVDNAQFEQLISEGAMLEYELVFGHYYGTSLSFINPLLAQGKDVVLTIDWQGSRQVKKMLVESKGIFILPPDIATLEKRLNRRGQDDQATIDARMADARVQSSHYDEFDYLLINDDFEQALDELISIIKADRLLRARQEIKHQSLIADICLETV